jgi:hypothetical protein
VRLLLDEMYPPVIARQLRDIGADVVAVLELDGLPGLADEQVLAAAREAGRSLVTENVADYMPLHVAALADGAGHGGLIFTSNARFPRGAPGTVGALVAAIDELVRDPPPRQPQDAWVHWL